MTQTLVPQLLSNDQITAARKAQVGRYGAAGAAPYADSIQFARAIEALVHAQRQQEAVPVASVYTMEALVPGGEVKCHVSLHKPMPSGTKLYTIPQAEQVVQEALDLIADYPIADRKNMDALTLQGIARAARTTADEGAKG